MAASEVVEIYIQGNRQNLGKIHGKRPQRSPLYSKVAG